MIKVNEQLIQVIVERIKDQLQDSKIVELEASGRHVHLSRVDIDRLFGEHYQLTKMRELSQPGQYVCRERVTLIGSKGIISNVVILGPERNDSQVEVSQTDARILGDTIPIRASGDIEGTPGITIVGNNQSVSLSRGLIIAQRHIHMTPNDATNWQLKHNELVSVSIAGLRPITFHNVVVRVSHKFATFMHIDFDEANSCGYTKGMKGHIIKSGEANE